VRPNGQKIIPPVRVADAPDNLVLESYVDSRFGFLRMEITPDTVQGKYFTVPRPQESWSDPPELTDIFELDWKNHNIRQNFLPQRTVRLESSISRRPRPAGRKYRSLVRAIPGASSCR
jgi:hypothetical protein